MIGHSQHTWLVELAKSKHHLDGAFAPGDDVVIPTNGLDARPPPRVPATRPQLGDHDCKSLRQRKIGCVLVERDSTNG